MKHSFNPASLLPLYASCCVSAVERLCMIDTVLKRVQFPLYNWLEMT
ncbi:hypothetical protein COO91_01662 [Nostoc flagelliforme CCNUN1]|uniref:Uncharacterized protein n=1 Tax=Nostoc flagelliforme CCNUN1 TaxID=2038116 RepID=A0A2K8SK13_9NOSO|nr:hypothetical protein COO91_01662 [Nostoc flagelliforme CCNUN1]